LLRGIRAGINISEGLALSFITGVWLLYYSCGGQV